MYYLLVFLVLGILLSLILPIKMNVEFNLNNFSIDTGFKIKFLNIVLYKAKLENKNLTTFFIDNKEVSTKQAYKDVEDNAFFKKYAYLIYMLKNTATFKNTSLNLCLGIKQRADITALCIGSVQSICGICKIKQTSIVAKFDQNICKLHFDCIISAKVANIIFESIRYFVWRKK